MVLTGQRAAAAAFATVRFERDASGEPGCVTVESLGRDVEQRLQRRVFVAQGTADLSVLVTYSRGFGAFYADVQLHGAEGKVLGHRRLAAQGKDCSVLDESLALVIALMVDLTRDEVKSRNETRLVPEASDMSIPTPTRARTDRWYSISLQATGALGNIPHFGFGGRLSTELTLTNAWSLDAGISSFLPMTRDDAANKGARFTLHAVDLGGCVAVTRSPMASTGLCAGTDLALETATGLGYAKRHSGRSMLVNPFAKLQGTYWMSRQLGLKAALGIAIPLIRDEFYAVRADGTTVSVFRAAAIVPIAQFGLCL
jgi:hypothetical protein